MRILIVNKFSDLGGAAIASQRLAQALNRHTKLEVKRLIIHGNSDNDTAVIAQSRIKNFFAQSVYAFGRLADYILLEDKSNKFFFDTARLGLNPYKHELTTWADIIHLHWINFGMFSLSGLKKLFQIGKPIAWTLHDMWALTGGCFHSRGCENYLTDCSNCPMLKLKNAAAKRFRKKQKAYSSAKLYPVAISTWIAKLIEQSPLFSQKAELIGNPLDTDFYSPMDKSYARKQLGLSPNKLYLGFVAFNPANPYKGGQYLARALEKIYQRSPKLISNLELLVIGKRPKNDILPAQIKANYVGYVSSAQKMKLLYNAMDVFVHPSLEENLSLVVQESMSCQVPTVAFATGGIPDMLDSEVGYLAKYKDIDDLAHGIELMLTETNLAQERAEKARQKIIRKYSYPVIAEKMEQFYRKISRD